MIRSNRYLRQVGPNLITKEMCYEAVEKDFAFVTIDLQNNFVKMRRDIKISFLNRVGTIGKANLMHFRPVLSIHILLQILGGLLGLFTGMSLLSMIEIGFWLIKFVWALLRSKQAEGKSYKN